MSTKLQWKSSAAASCWHTVEQVAEGRRLVQPEWSEVMHEPLAALAAASRATPAELHELLNHLIPLSAGVRGDAELAQVALSKAFGPGRAAQCVEPVAAALRRARLAFDTQAGDVQGELELRRAPLEQQWAARGPGLLASVGRLAEPELLSESADVLLVLPVLGGGGAAHMRYNAIHIEAVLADPEPSSPEVLRMGWLLAMLNLDLPRYSDHFRRDRLHLLARLALVPVLLAAGEEVELTRCDQATIETALRAWHVGQPSHHAALAEMLLAWGQTYHDSQTPFGLALRALDQMVEA